MHLKKSEMAGMGQVGVLVGSSEGEEVAGCDHTGPQGSNRGQAFSEGLEKSVIQNNTLSPKHAKKNANTKRNNILLKVTGYKPSSRSVKFGT